MVWLYFFCNETEVAPLPVKYKRCHTYPPNTSVLLEFMVERP